MPVESLDMADAGAVDGDWTSSGWVDGTDGLILTTGNVGNIGLVFSSSQSAPRRCTAATLTLQLAAESPGSAAVVAAYLYRDVATVAWSNTHSPGAQNDQVGALGGPIRVGTATVSATTASGTDITVTLDEDLLTAVSQHSGWDEDFQFDVRCTSGGPLTFLEYDGSSNQANAPRLSWTHTTVPETGISSYRQSVSRVDECPICGWRSFREDWAMCGYHKQLECPRCIDPRDHLDPPRVYRPESPLVGEG